MDTDKYRNELYKDIQDIFRRVNLPEIEGLTPKSKRLDWYALNTKLLAELVLDIDIARRTPPHKTAAIKRKILNLLNELYGGDQELLAVAEKNIRICTLKYKISEYEQKEKDERYYELRKKLARVTVRRDRLLLKRYPTEKKYKKIFRLSRDNLVNENWYEQIHIVPLQIEKFKYQLARLGYDFFAERMKLVEELKQSKLAERLEADIERLRVRYNRLSRWPIF